MSLIELFPGLLRNYVEIKCSDIRIIPLQFSKPKKCRKSATVKDHPLTRKRSPVV